MTKHYLDIQEKVIDGITKYYYYDEAQLASELFDTEEEAIEHRNQYGLQLIAELMQLKQYPVDN